MDNAEPDARSDDATPLPSEAPAGSRLGKTYTAVNLGALLGPQPALAVDLDSAGLLDFGKIDAAAMRRAVDQAMSGYDTTLVDTPPSTSTDPQRRGIVPYTEAQPAAADDDSTGGRQ